MGSVPEWQEFFASRAKPPYRFRERGSAPRMAGHGWIARAVCVHDLAFLLAVDPDLVEECAVPWLAAEDAEGRALRRILMLYSAITPEVTKLIPETIITAVVESQPDHHVGSAVASRKCERKSGRLSH